MLSVNAREIEIGGNAISSRWSRACLTLLALTLSFTNSACLEIDVAGNWIPPVSGIPDPPADAPLVQLRLSGAGMWADDWPRALTISRFFYSSVANRSGSPAKLLEPGLRELLRQQGYRVAPGVLRDAADATSEAELEFQIHYQRNILLWLPPREFIQTPRARARGTVRVDLATEQSLRALPADGAAGLVSRDPAAVWRQSYEFGDELRVLPGEESDGLARGAHLAFENHLRWLQINIPRAGSLKTGAAAAEAQP